MVSDLLTRLDIQCYLPVHYHLFDHCQEMAGETNAGMEDPLLFTQSDLLVPVRSLAVWQTTMEIDDTLLGGLRAPVAVHVLNPEYYCSKDVQNLSNDCRQSDVKETRKVGGPTESPTAFTSRISSIASTAYTC